MKSKKNSSKGKGLKNGFVHFGMNLGHGEIHFKVPKKEIPKGVPRTMKYGKEIDNPWHEKSVFFWCLHCERTYRRGECREIDGLQMCPYDGCDGDTFMDAWAWESIREANPGYPVIPEEGKVYPMYPEKGKSAKGKK
jgi:hypothetical protein